MSVSVAIRNVAKTCGEGPFWEESTRALLTMDCFNGEIIRWHPETGETQRVKFDETATFVIPCQSGGYLTTQMKKVVHFNWENPEGYTTLAEMDRGKQVITRFNDGKCDTTGRLWAGTNADETSPGVRPPGGGSLYSLGRDGEVKAHMGGITISNGMTWSLDYTRMYYIDSDPRRVWVFDCDVNTGTLSNSRPFLEFPPDTIETLGYPDGMTTDAEGKLWIACYGVGKIIRVDPETADILLEVSLPAQRTTSLCFGGPTYEDIYVTSDATGMTEEDYKQQPLAGSIFKVSGLGIKGLPPNLYQG